MQPKLSNQVTNIKLYRQATIEGLFANHAKDPESTMASGPSRSFPRHNAERVEQFVRFRRWLGGAEGKYSSHIKGLGQTYGFKPPSADKAWKIGSITVRLQCEDAEANLVARQMSHSLHTQARHYQGVVGPIHVSHLPIFDDFWKRDPLLHYAPNADRISCDRIRELSHHTYFVDKCHTCDQGVTRV